MPLLPDISADKKRTSPLNFDLFIDKSEFDSVPNLSTTSKVESCNAQPCPETGVDRDCAWEEWRDWTACATFAALAAPWEPEGPHSAGG